MNFLLSNDIECSTFISDMGLFYSITIELDEFNLVFRDSLKIINTSVERLGLSLNRNDTIKGETPLLEKTPQEILPEWYDYIRTDIATIGIALYTFFIEFKFSKFTNASETLKEFKKTVNFRKKFPLLSTEQDTFLRKGYRGGMTYLNPLYSEKIFNEDLTQYDINSMYPFILLDFPMPVGLPIVTEKFDGVIDKSMYHVFEIFVKFELKKGYVPTVQTKDILTLNKLGIKKSDYITSTKGEFIPLTVTCVDWEIMQEHYNIIDVEYGSCYSFLKQKGLFEEHINKYKELKEQAKADGDKLLEMFAKIMLNSLYGKFGSKPISQQKIPYLENGVLKFEMGEPEEVDTNYLPVAMFTTSLARAYLIEHIQDNFDNFVYCDTDSIHVRGKANTHNNLELHKTTFGKWSIDGEYSKALYLRQKLYMVTDKNNGLQVKGAGITADVKKILNYDNFRIGASFDETNTKQENLKKQIKQVKGGAIIVRVPFTIKSNDFGF